MDIITKSIILNGMPSPEDITIFNTEDKKNPQYFDISKMCGRTATVTFDWINDKGEKLTETCPIVYPNGMSEDDTKSFVCSTIMEYLSLKYEI